MVSRSGSSGKLTQMGLVLQFYEDNPNRDIEHNEAVDCVTIAWKERTGEVFRDPDRAIRKLHQEGYLIKVGKGVYRYDPDGVELRVLEDFSASQKEEILVRDGYKCVVCGLGRESGLELHVDHIKPKDKGGGADLENGQTLCSRHNFLKKNLNQTEAGKKMIINLFNLAQSKGEVKIESFCRDILEVYEKHDINGHIEWEE